MKITYNGAGSTDLFIKILECISKPEKTKSVIDLCCCSGRVTKALNFGSKVYVDINDHHFEGDSPLIKTDVLKDHPVFTKIYDVSLCLDGIEHLHKRDGYFLLDRMSAISHKSIVFTPLDPWMIDSSSSDPEAHKSLWTPYDINEKEYALMICPYWHPTLKSDIADKPVGAWFFWKCNNINSDFCSIADNIGFFLKDNITINF